MTVMADPQAAPLVSAIVPIYNGAAFLADAICSITAQTYPAVEIVAVDDGSSDESARIVQAVGRRQIHYLFQPNAGTATARNRGVALATGRYLAFLDQDDLWLPEKLAAQMALLTADPELDLVLGHVWQGAFPAGAAAVDLLACADGQRLAGYLPSTLLVRREAFDLIGGFAAANALTESFDWFVRAKDLKLKTHLAPEIVTIRRIHGANKGLVHRQARAEYARVLKYSLDRRRDPERALSSRA